MTKLTFLRIAAALLLGAAFVTAFAAQRTFVASTGLDTNLCSITAPCRTFTRAMTQTDANGEVIVLDSAGYGFVTITKSVSIIAPEGIYAGISVFATQDGITVNAGPGDKVVLRGLSINGQGGNAGIRVVAAGQVHIERCTVSNMGTSGISVEGGTAVHVSQSVLRSNSQDGLSVIAPSIKLHVSGTRVAENGINGIRSSGGGELVLSQVDVADNAVNGIQVFPAAGRFARITMRDSSTTGNGESGLLLRANNAGSGVAGAVAGSTAGSNGFDGFRADAQGPTPGTASLTLDGSEAAHNGSGVAAAGAASVTVYVRNSILTRNFYGLAQVDTAELKSCGNNLDALSANPPLGTITPVTCNQ